MADTPPIDRPPAQFESPPASWFQRHQDKLWWLHSGYALLLGFGIMWLGARNYNYLRVTLFHVGFIWLSSLFLPKYLNHARLSERWVERLRLFVNFFNKNFYQQVLFFILPIYYASATLSSANIIFVALLAISAILSTLDVIYDRHLSVRRSLTASFFAFNLFALINVMLPVLWSVSNARTTRIAAVMAALGFVSLYHPFPHWIRLRFVCGLGAAILFVVLVELGRAYIPPAPLRLVNADFGTGVERESRQVNPVIVETDPVSTRELYVLTAIKAPLGLKERVRHRWYKNDKLIWVSSLFDVVGGREEGYRLWTRYDFAKIESGATVRVDVETEGGQLIGRAAIVSAKAPRSRDS